MSIYTAKGEGGCHGRPPISSFLTEAEQQPGYRTPEEQVQRYIELGILAPYGCKTCKNSQKVILLGGTLPYGPSHKASPRCQSGGRPHCTCDTCF